MRFSVYQQSQAGGRASNQDRMGYCFTRESLLLLLADGMGGHSHGELAATLTLQTMGSLFQKAATLTVADPSAFLDELIYSAHLALHRYRSQQRLAETPRTTIVACLVQEGKAQWAHCGDSRLYWLRSGRILARTTDHSHVEKLVAMGRLSPHQRMQHPDRNKLYNCLGAPSLPIITKSSVSALNAGDQLLLCSDGLWGSIPEHELAYRLSARPLEEAVPEMVRSAVQIGGKNGDNVTALALTWLGADIEMGGGTFVTEGLPPNRVITSIQSAPQDATITDKSRSGAQAIEQAMAHMRLANQKT
jgi:protein phosphatase